MGWKPQFPVNIALAALAVQRGQLFPPADASGFEQPMEAPLRQVVVTGVGHWRGEGPSRSSKLSVEGGNMAKTDQAGRPVVVVTGMGVVTSLGAGKDENWRKLTAGESGIRAI